MRMLMGASDIYADGKVQSTITNGLKKKICLFFFLELFFYLNRRSIK